jgi:hypothetical protein
VTTSLKAAVGRLFDDASLFPPARLPMAAALAAHERLRRGPLAPTVGPFLYPASRFDELEASLSSGQPRPPELGVIAYGGDAPWAVIYAMPGIVQVEAPQSARPPEPPRGVRRYVEIAPHADAAALADALDEVAGTGARAKVRCGGLTPDDVPSCDWLAAAVAGCAERGIPLKATAGLHHPFRAATGPDGPRHGLVNLLAAAGAAHAGADAATLSEILAVEGDGSVGLLEQVDGARGLLASVGTCSIEETVEGLTAQGLL